MDIEYDLFKAEANARKHKVTFEEAATAFNDLNAIAMEDTKTSHSNEPRWLLLGMSAKLRLLIVVYTYRPDYIRIISARKATKQEAHYYA